MPSENYKKWTVLAIAAIIIGIIVFTVTTSDKKTETPSPVPQTSPVPGGPLTDMVTPPLEMGKLPDNPQELARLGDTYFESGRYDMAVQVYEKVLKSNPNDIDTYNDMGLALYYMGKPAAAIDALRKGTQVVPSYQRAWLSLGFILMSTGQNAEAGQALKKAVEIDPNSDVGLEAARMIGQIK